MKTKNKTLIVLIAAIFLIAIIAVAVPNISRADDKEQTQTSALLVDTLHLKETDMSIESQFAGTVVSETMVNIVSTVSGMVEEIFVTPGTYVEEGEELFKINDDVAQLNYDKASATYNQAAMAAEVSITNAERSVITAQSSHNTLVTQRDNTNAELQGAVDTAQAAVNAVNAAKPADIPLPLEADFDLDGDLSLSVDEQLAFDTKLAEVNLANQTAQEGWQTQLSQAQAVLDKAVQTRDQTYASFNNQISYASQSVENAQSTVTAAINSGNASINSAGVGISTAALQVEQYTVTAPISGVVDFMNVNVGNMTSPSAIACSVSDHENLLVQFSVSESVKNELSVGQSINVLANDSSFKGSIIEIAPVADSKTKLYTVVADVDATIDELPLNSTVKVSAKRGNVSGSIIVPYSALQFSADKTYVYTVKNGVAVQTAVSLGAYNDTDVEILEGLSVNDVVITSWSESLRNGMAVTAVQNPQR